MNKPTIKYAEVMQINAVGDTGAVRSVAKGQVIAIERPRAKLLSCTSGSLWVTRENDPMDYVLVENEKLAVTGGGRLVVSGLASGSYSLS